MSIHRTVFYQDYVTLWNWGSAKKEGLFSKESQRSLHIPSQSTKASLHPEQQSYSSAHIPVVQGHARAGEEPSSPSLPGQCPRTSSHWEWGGWLGSRGSRWHGNAVHRECSGLGSLLEAFHASVKKQKWTLEGKPDQLCHPAPRGDLCFSSYTKD